jgi:hypothetical protein
LAGGGGLEIPAKNLSIQHKDFKSVTETQLKTKRQYFCCVLAKKQLKNVGRNGEFKKKYIRH